MKKSCPSQFVEQLFQNYAHKCNCNEAIEFRTKIVQSLKTSSIKLTSEVTEEIYIGNVPMIDVNCVNILTN